MSKLSVLDLSPIVQGSSASKALANSLDLAKHAELWGYKRYWVAEHHNMQGIASAATAVVVGHIASGTSTIRVGSGGVMLPNHAPLVIAEQFGTLESLYPGRIDLGLGRAPGTDMVTAGALRRNLQASTDEFPRDVVELRNYFGEKRDGQKVSAVPGSGLNVPIWILGSSLFGASLAAALGLPYAFASHFAPTALEQALEVYRTRFEPSDQMDRPYVMLGFNICAADTEEDANYLRSSSLQSVVSLRKGSPGKLPPPIKDYEDQLEAQDRAMISQFTQCSAVGSPPVVAEKVEEFLSKTKADELMIVSQIYDHDARLRSYEIASELIH